MGLFGDADLVMSRDEAYTRTFQYLVNNTPIDWTLYTVTMQLSRWDGAGIDLSQYLAPMSSDHTTLVLTVPRIIVATIPHDSRWDLVAVLISNGLQAFRTPKPPGRVLVQLGVTAQP